MTSRALFSFNGNPQVFTADEIVILTGASAPFLNTYGFSNASSNLQPISPFFSPSSGCRGELSFDGNRYALTQGSISVNPTRIFDSTTYPFSQITTASSSSSVASADVKFSKNRDFLLMGLAGAPRYKMWPIVSDVYSNVTQPASQSQTGSAVDMDSTETYFIGVSGAATNPDTYKRSGTGASSVLSGLAMGATTPAGAKNAIKWANSNPYVAIGLGVSPFLQAWSRSGDTLTAATINSNPLSSVSKVIWYPDDTKLVCINAGTDRLLVYSRSGSTFTKLTSGVGFPSEGVIDAKFNATGTKLFLLHATANLSVFNVTSSGLVYTEIGKFALDTTYTALSVKTL